MPKNINWEKVKESLLDILFPRFCFGCGKEGSYFCRDCKVFLTENSLICPICGEASYYGKSHPDCGLKADIDGLVSIWDYEGAIKKAIVDIKASNHFYVANRLLEEAFLIISRDQNRFTDFLNFILVEEAVISFVPGRDNKKRRGLKSVGDKNHAEVIAKRLAKITGSPKPKALLSKVKETKKQANLKRKERLKNVKGAFKATKDKLPKRVLLVDDVFTTGATMRECGKTLKKEGVKTVWGFTLARKV